MIDTLTLSDMNIDTTLLFEPNHLDLFLTNLATLLRVDTLYVATVCPESLDLSILSCLQQGVFVPNAVIDFKSMPCFAAYQRGYAEYEQDLASRFPDQKLLQEWQAQAYLGIRLNDVSGQPIGVLSAFFPRQLSRHKLELNLIRLVSGFLEKEIQLTPSSTLSDTPTTSTYSEELNAYTFWLEDNIAKGLLSSWSYFLEQDKLVCSDSAASIIETENVEKIDKLEALLALVHKSDKASVFRDFYNAIESNSTTSIRSIFNITTLEGNAKRIQSDIYPIVDESGLVYRLDCISKDITAEELTKKRVSAQERILETVLATTPVGLVKLNAKREIKWVNKQACKMFGYELEDFHRLREKGVLNTSSLNLYFDEDIEQFEEYYQEIYANKRNNFTLNTRYRHRDGSILWTKLTVTAVKDDVNNIQYFINTIQDLTEEQDNRQRLSIIESVYKHSTEGIMLCDANERIIDVNPAFEDITGYSAEDAIGRTHDLLRSGVHDEAFYNGISEALLNNNEWKGVIWSRNRAGEIFAQQVTLSSIKEGDKLKYFFAVFTDVTEDKKTEQQIMSQSNFDTLTGLPNRQYFSAEIRQVIDKSAKNSQKFAILYIDIDDFKSINNSEDFMAGDRLLQETAERLKYRSRDNDFLARIDGDEFAFIIPEVVNKRQAEVYAKQLQGVFAQAYQLSNQQRYVTASVGITMYPEDGVSVEALMQSAEQAIFEAKRKGRNQCVMFTQELSDAAILKHQTVVELADAIKRGSLDVYYQPIVDNVTGKIDKVEALVRWKHKDRGFISPAEFIPLAEEGGLIQGLGEYVLDQACCDLKILHEAGYPYIEMSVNRSSLEFKTVDMQVSEWLKVIASHNLPYSSVTMEITESLLMDMDGQYMQRINALKNAGVKIAIDDFGTGYSSLNYLRSLPADIVKIDRSFIINIPENQQDNLLLDGIITIIHNLGMKVVTEGVETKAQLNYLQENKCDYSQGFLLCRPIPLHELLEFMTKNESVFN
ncbi:sensor domain-containing protein [Moritella viscosa]|uniref:Sensory box protein n=2 Tax=Moritella viscosa TaxID=80854 RepID=A0ABY1HIQ4_9GAMM|nr:EAL domain-containing protein [Moritella viscosa]CED58278.1 putative regulator, GGDEF family protein [Moritella viscosa]SGY94774.1 Sensory box protein [Moritella viscosa]SGY99916.1 Sensory box protein [Moritella viscosa]SGZ06518.1 Sensory box protein [Moritella viscosa]SHO10299.1 Sensory box protein [Moritella viscosa]